MDNKEAIKNIKDLKKWKYLGDRKYMEALDKAIASLEAWDKVKEDIKHSQFIFLDGDKEIECIPIFEVMNIINKHLKEVEE